MKLLIIILNIYLILSILIAPKTLAQNVGVGNTNPLEKFHVSGNIRSDSLAGIGKRSVFADPNGTLFDSLVVVPPSSDDWKLLGNGGTNPALNFLGTTDNADLIFRTNNTEKVRILPGGNVGINTTAPSERLEIGNSGQFSLMAVPGSTDPGDILFKNGNASLKARIWSEPAANEGLLLNGTGTSTPAVYIDSKDRVGIQTSTPAWPLEVSTGGNKGHLWDSATVARFRNRSNSSCTFNKYWDWRVGYCGQLGLQSAVDNSNPDFNILNNSANPSPGPVISLRTSGPLYTLVTDNIGNVGLGLSNPGAKFHIYQNANNVEYIRLTNNANNNFGILFGNSFAGFTNNAGVVYYEVNGLESHMFGGEVIPDQDNGGGWTVGNASRRWRTIFATNGTINTSDRREKKNIKSLSYGLKEVLKLEPVSFEWKEDKGDGLKKIGFIAQDVYEVLPEVVYKAKNENEKWGINYAEINALLTKAIQEQQELILKQKEQIEVLINKQQLIEKDIQDLKSKLYVTHSIHN
jgi:hypothetical protein